MTQPLLSSLRRAALAPLALGTLLAAASASAAPNEGTAVTSGGSSNGNIASSIISIGGVNQNTQGTIWFGLAACQDNLEVEFRLDNVPDARESLDIYVGESCNTAESRDGEGTDCILIGNEEIVSTTNVRIRLNAGDIIRAALNRDDCGSASSEEELWFLAVDSSGTTGAVTSANFSRLVMNVDTDPPAAPTRIRGGTGENQIPVSWSTGSEEVDSFEIFVDSGNGMGVSDASTAEPPDPSGEDGGAANDEDEGSGGTTTECGTGALREGASADSVRAFFAKREGSPTATSTNLSGSDIEGGLAAVAVVAVDEAGNKSTLSEVTCVMVVPTTGWKDLVEMQEGQYPQGCPCAATGPAQLDAAWPIALALSVLAYRRRTRS